MTRLERPGDVVEVRWLDSALESGWGERKELTVTNLDTLSVGYVLRDDDVGLQLTMGPHGQGVLLNQLFIPRQAIVRVRRLARRDAA